MDVHGEAKQPEEPEAHAVLYVARRMRRWQHARRERRNDASPCVVSTFLQDGQHLGDGEGAVTEGAPGKHTLKKGRKGIKRREGAKREETRPLRRRVWQPCSEVHVH